MAPSKVSIHRMSRDLKNVLDDPPAGVSAWLPDESNSAFVEAQVIGPDDTPYSGGLFQLRVVFPDRYPMEPPNVKFKTKVYHPNVSHDGNICLSILNMPPKGNWSPSLSLRTVLISIQNLLSAPNPDDPLDAEAAKELKTQPHVFQSRASEWTRIYANPNGSKPGILARAAATEQPSPSAAGPSGAAIGEGRQGLLSNAELERQRPGPGSRQAEATACEAEAARGQNLTKQEPPVEEGRVGMSEVPPVQGRSSSGSTEHVASSSGQMQSMATGNLVLSAAGGDALVPPRSRLALGKRSRA
ncbi:hypothetical protein VaNZ11_004619 [Volvox africanus]|uniref:UBC core domain-containing protein n=1 Tax=Volvox africanus TaxID=51714 RepID=A0ABQ5RXT7_9CHLO|nr:hypothetical protein VaNZ11_004619 [Volvox africanus]